MQVRFYRVFVTSHSHTRTRYAIKVGVFILLLIFLAVLMNDVEVTTCKSRGKFTFRLLFGLILLLSYCIVEVSTLVGSNQGCLDGKGIVVKMTNPFGIVVNPTDSCLYFCDYGNKLVRKIMQSGKHINRNITIINNYS